MDYHLEPPKPPAVDREAELRQLAGDRRLLADLQALAQQERAQKAQAQPARKRGLAWWQWLLLGTALATGGGAVIVALWPF